MDVMQLIHDVRHIVGHRLLHVGGGGTWTAGYSTYLALSRTPCWWVSYPLSCGLALCRPAGRWVASHPNLSGVSKRPSTGAPQPSLHTVRPCHVTAGAEGWSVSCLSPGAPTPLAWAVTRSSGPGHCSSRDTEAAKVGLLGHPPLLMPHDTDCVHLRPLGEVVSGNQKVSVPTLVLLEGSCDVWRASPSVLRRFLLRAWGHCSWFWELGSLRSCHTVGTASRRRSSAASSTTVWLYLVLLIPRCPPCSSANTSVIIIICFSAAHSISDSVLSMSLSWTGLVGCIQTTNICLCENCSQKLARHS
jgi:hypothetical protein